MQTAPHVRHEDVECYETLTTHTQAVERALQVMHTHLREPLTLEDLAAAAYLSPFHFHRVFRRRTGIAPGEFLSALRLEEARHLLITTSLSVTDICFSVGYSSTGSFTSRFTQRVGLSPRLLRQRTHTFDPPSLSPFEAAPQTSPHMSEHTTLAGRISIPASFRGMVYIGLFSSPIPQGVPVRCTKLNTPCAYLLQNIPDGVYYLRAAAFPATTDLLSALLPGKRILLSNPLSPLIIRRGQIEGDPNIVLHAPLLTDPPLVMGLPLL